MQNFIGILPCGGQATRLRPFKYPKQLLPVAFTKPNKDGDSFPILAAEYSLRCMRLAGIQKCVITTHDWKPEILRYFSDGHEFGMSIAYVCQEEAKSMPQALDLAYEWVKDRYVALAWPDTLFEPTDALNQLCDKILKEAADLVLGAFPNENPDSSFPIYHDKNGSVYEVKLRPKTTKFKNTCGLAVWSPKFTNFLHKNIYSEGKKEEQQIMNLFAQAIKEGFKVFAVDFKKGSYTDLGIVSGLGSLLINSKSIHF